MKTQHLAATLAVALLALTGCIVEPPHPVVYRAYPAGTYAPAPQPGVQPIAPPAVSPDTPPGVPPVPSQEQPEVLTRGPVHEAFAQPMAAQNQPGVVVAGQPPANVTETPPAERPAGGTSIWVPGYWSWDSERSNFIWVSGCWRVAPPRMTWVPGYWARTGSGWQWVSGFWTPVTSQEIAYLPAPPAVTDIQPAGPPPTADDFWVPGCWYWYQTRYVYRSGYWLHQQPGWVWSPSHCIWTPRGYIFVDGHWDYAMEDRGVLFAPVCFPGRVSAGVSFSFSPSITVDIGVLSASLFACPRYSHYYFGDYYDDAYVRIGIYPWFDCVTIGTWYDPIFVYARWDNHHNHHDEHWEDHQRHDYQQRHDDRNLRPPRTYREQEARVARLPEAQRHEQQMARPLSTIVSAPATAGKFEHVNVDAHQKVVKQAEDTHAFRTARSGWETVTSPASRAAPAATAPIQGTVARPPPQRSPSAQPRDTAPVTIQPDRVSIPAPFVAPRAEAPRGSDRSDRGTPNQPSDERGERGGDRGGGRSGNSRW